MSYGWFVVRWLHLLAMAFFVGGQMMLAAVVVPAARHPADREALRAIARRFGQGTLVALAVLFATGTALAFHPHLWGNPTFHIKLALVLIVCALLVWHIRRTGMSSRRRCSCSPWRSSGSVSTSPTATPNHHPLAPGVYAPALMARSLW